MYRIVCRRPTKASCKKIPHSPCPTRSSEPSDFAPMDVSEFSLCVSTSTSAKTGDGSKRRQTRSQEYGDDIGRHHTTSPVLTLALHGGKIAGADGSTTNTGNRPVSGAVRPGRCKTCRVDHSS